MEHLPLLLKLRMIGVIGKKLWVILGARYGLELQRSTRTVVSTLLVRPPD